MNYGTDFEKFYNDKFYCRRKLIELNSAVKEKISPVSVGASAMKGKDGWLFFRGDRKVHPDTESRAFQFVNYVHKNSDVSVIYPYEELLAEKTSGGLLYYKNDTHWNYDGAYIGYKELMKEIQKNLGILEKTFPVME